ncbi:MAG: hypothetical protein E6R03_09025 [Hyphomicrobiaceae bacterium]|nr:MAG: hypothetical protein E6R03_09025 [Hyphomicrobiaceae bacterium]
METTSLRVTVAYLMQRASHVKRESSHTYLRINVPHACAATVGKIRRRLPPGARIDRYSPAHGYVVVKVLNGKIPVIDLSALSRWD